MKNLTKQTAFSYLIKISLVFSTVSIFLVLLCVSMYWHSNLRKTNDSEIKNYTRSLDASLRNVSKQEFVLNLQKLLLLQEVILFDQNCNVLAATTLMSLNHECKRHSPSDILNIHLNGQHVSVFYRLEVDRLSVIRDHWKFVLILFFVFFVFSALGFSLFLNQSILKPLKRLLEINDNSAPVPYELSFIEEKVSEMQSEILKSSLEKEYFNFARKVVHDIRNPLSVIRSTSHKEAPDSVLFSKLDEIDYHISSLLDKKSTIHDYRVLNISKAIASTFQEMKSVWSFDYEIESDVSFVISPVHEFDIKNILSNLIRNSCEAGANKIVVQVEFREEFVNVSIKDNGHGIPVGNRKSLFDMNFTTKDNGNGIGLHSIKKHLVSRGSDIILGPDVDCTVFKVRLLAYILDSKSAIVHIEDDRYLRLGFSKDLKEIGLKLHSFESFKSFSDASLSLDAQTFFMIDSNLSESEKGELLAKDLFDKGFSRIFLASNDISIDLKEYPWIKGTIPKNLFPQS